MTNPFSLHHHATQRSWKPDDPLALEIISKLIEREQTVTIVQQAGQKLMELPPFISMTDEVPREPDPATPLVIISDRLIGPRPEVDRLVILRPPTLTLGIASRRELFLEELQEAVRLFCRRAGYSLQSVMALAASARRKQQSALDEFADQHQLLLLHYDDTVLKKSPLPAPGKMAGTCAVAATLAAGVRAPEVNSTPFFGKLSLALGRRRQ